MEHPYLGVFVNDKMYSRIPKGDTKYEAIQYYLEAGRRYGLTPCFFRLQDMVPGAAYIKAYVPTPKGYEPRQIPAPKVIHNRAIYNTQKEFRRLEALEQTGTHIFNRWNRFGKLFVHNTLMKDASLRPHLPGTLPATVDNIKKMMALYDEIIIKPDRSSIGRGVMMLARTSGRWKLHYPQSLSVKNKTWRCIPFRSKLPSLLIKRLSAMDYIVQQRLPLATYRGRPFDMRVSVQRNATGQWQITGIVAKVAAASKFITNVAQGGKVHKLENILAEEYGHLQADTIFNSIADFSLRTANQLSQQLPHLADLGLDVGITSSGFPVYIECNGKDQRYSFREANMMEEWKSTYYNPVAYAKYLLDGGKPLLT
jgi:hypothetical protein